MLELNIPEVIAEVAEAFTRYERALVANDVAELDMLFWDSPRTLRFGVGENLYGYEAIAAFRNSRPPIDLARQLRRRDRTNNRVACARGHHRVRQSRLPITLRDRRSIVLS
jgi:hypothetical protein